MCDTASKYIYGNFCSENAQKYFVVVQHHRMKDFVCTVTNKNINNIIFAYSAH
jgi:hypothetical protein